MTKNSKKRALSEGATIEKTQVELVDTQKTKNKKSKLESKVAVQNGQGAKGNKPWVSTVPEKVKSEKQGIEDKDKALKKLQNKQAYREKRKLDRQNKEHGPKTEFTVEQLQEKIKDIESRDALTKSAKKRLAVLKRKLHIADGTYVPKQEHAKKQVGKPKGNKSLEAAKEKKVISNDAHNKKVKGGKVEVKTTKADKKQGGTQGSLLLVKTTQDDEDDDDEDDDDDEEDISELNTTKEESDDEVESGVEEEEDDDDEDEDEDEDDENEEEEDEDDEEDEDEAVTSQKPKLKSNTQKDKESTNQDGKKKRFVLFVGNLPFTSTLEDVKKHFLTKVSEIVDVRIPVSDANKPRGIAYVEFNNSTDYEKGLSLHHSFIGGRRINVQYSANDKAGIAKNMKLNALRKVGKLAGSQNKNNKKFAAGKKGKQT